ncbi:putative mitochondrial saccharopine dehydrogenase-like oxidoreductase [Iris pallida]|uniref:Mitochondrial saccharopine dehydrogenase-like oxidoreductase n=1 Tax=Iris pallida TaxID=29817 RepID=A0AAX6I337_IRIPA|nr:putative mitochondrial saccharopine dehydrogenase-like oxidoreductase [Iris pallida]
MESPAVSPREFDLVILGASGFTGKHVLRETLKFISAPNSPIKTLAVAGRNPKKLSQTLTLAGAPPLPIVDASTGDPSSLLSLARRTRLLLNCVGPFRLHGAPVVSACVAAGTDYLDITGEPEFMERAEAERHEEAVRTGSLVVSACGFDSVPAELGFMFNSRQWSGEAAPGRVEAYVSLESDRRIVGNLGTYESAVLGVANADKLRELRRSRPKRARPLIPGPPPPKGGPLIEHQKTLGLWAVKLPSADATVVRRTLAAHTENPNGLPGVEESEEYAEKRKKFWSSVKPAHFGVKLGSKSLLGILRALLTGVFIGIFANFSFGRSLLLNFPQIFSLGWFRKTGPTEEEVSSASFKMWFVGHGYSDARRASESGGKPDTEIITRVSGPEIGYVSTPIILVQCALVVLSQRHNLPKGGVFPPGIVFGPTDLQQRLQENGISFDLVSKKTLEL